MNTIKKMYCIMATVFAMTAMFLTSCSNDLEPDVIKNDGMVDIVLTTSLPAEINTYGENSLTSSEGGLKNLLDKDGYYVRYIMEVYPQSSNEVVKRLIKYKELTASESVNSITFETRMLAAKYRFVFYADIVRDVTFSTNSISDLGSNCRGNQYFISNIDDSDKDVAVLYKPDYNNPEGMQVSNLQTISADNSANSVYGHTSTEQYDVYTCVGEVDLRNETSRNFTLKRPFAKLRIITTDAEDALLPEIDWNKSIVSLTGDNTTVLNNSFNALTEETSLSGRAYYTTTYKTRTQETDIYEKEMPGEKTLGVFYIPVSNSNSFNLNFTVSVKSGSTTIVENAPYQVENVPLAKNKVTTIKGKLLTKKIVNSITIDDVFDTPDDDIILGKEATSMDELVHSLTGKNETITYSGKISKEDGFLVNFDEIEANEVSTYAVVNPLYKEGNDADVTLNFTSIEDGAVLTFKGVNAPKTLRIKTGTKCSLRIDMENSDIFYGGNTYKYIITNAGSEGHINGTQYDAFFQAGKGDAFFSQDKTNSHLIAIGSDFQLLSNSSCTFATRHDGKKCTFISDVLTPWLNANSGLSVWDFVEANK